MLTFPRMEKNPSYTVIADPDGVIYKYKDKVQKVKAFNEVYKFGDNTLTRVSGDVNDMIKDNRLGYNHESFKGRAIDKSYFRENYTTQFMDPYPSVIHDELSSNTTLGLGCSTCLCRILLTPVIFLKHPLSMSSIVEEIERIHSALVNGESFSYTQVENLEDDLLRFLSNHRPILLRESNHDYGPIPFRYFNHWTELDGFNKFVIDTWNSAPVETNAMRNVMQKFKFLKGKIREWLKIYKSKNGGSGILKEELNRIDADIDKGLASDIIINRRMEVIKSIQYLDKIHVMDLAQKAKVKWAIEGDENSRYFHGVLNKKRSQSNIRGIMVDGKWQDNPKVIKSEFFLHFRKRFEKPSANRILIDMNFPKTISIDQQTELEGAVSKEEVKKAVWDCGSDKSPGPDGFSFGFYRKFWTCIENDVFAAVNYFFTFGDIPKGCNACFIALIPKVHDANLVKDFRPISLIGSIYKIIAKILANRLVGVLGDIVNEVQSAFISDRQILEIPGQPDGGGRFSRVTGKVSPAGVGGAREKVGVLRNVNTVNARNPTVRACYECGSTDHVRSACPRLNRARGPEENRPNQVAANNGGQGRGNQGNQARGRAFMSGAEEARQDPNIMTGLEPSDLGFRFEIKIASGKLVEIDKVIKCCKLEIKGHVL
ncbi:RNA-directed DNA polymerase, eukaryota [Tanacetum coccineum]